MEKRGADSDSLIGKIIGDCEILQLIEPAGGMGNVYVAKQRFPSRIVALKIPKKDSIIYLLYRGNERFRREIDAMTEAEHPHVVPIYGAGEEYIEKEEIVYLIMKYVEDTFKSLMIDMGIPKNREDIKFWVANYAQIADGLGFIHERGYLHRDQKPSNNFFERIRDKGRALVGDLSAVGIIDRPREEELREVTKLTNIDQLLGTPSYMSPEQTMIGSILDERSDYFSLGINLYEALTGHKPFEKEVWEDESVLYERIRNRDPRNPRFFNPEIPRSLQSIVLKLLEKNPDDRHESIDELLDDFKQFRIGEKVNVRSYWERPLKGGVEKIKDYIKSHRRHVIIGLLSLLTIVSSGYFLRQRHVENLREKAAIERQEEQYLSSIDFVLDQFDMTNPTDYVTMDSLLRELKPRIVKQKIKPLIEEWRQTHEFPYITNKGIWTLYKGNIIYTEGIFIDLLNEISEIDSSFKKDILDWTDIIMPKEGEKLPRYDIRYLYFKHAYEMTGDERYRKVIFDAVEYFNKRFVESAGYFKRMDFRQRKKSLSEEIIDIGSVGDKLLPLIWHGIHKTDDKEYKKELLSKLIKHVKTTSNILIREDGSIREFGYFVVDEKGEQVKTYEATLYGHGYLEGPYKDNPSCPSRFQALAIDGFVNTYKEITKVIDTVNDQARKKELLEFRESVLEKAILLADYYIHNLPEDYVPYFDFMHPDLNDSEKRNNVPKDASPVVMVFKPFLGLAEIKNDSIYEEVAYGGLHTILTKKDDNRNRVYISTDNQNDEGVILGVCWNIKNNEVNVSNIGTGRNFMSIKK